LLRALRLSKGKGTKFTKEGKSKDKGVLGFKKIIFDVLGGDHCCWLKFKNRPERGLGEV
jgi:hypothetical protein